MQVYISGKNGNILTENEDKLRGGMNVWTSYSTEEKMIEEEKEVEKNEMREQF